MSNKISSLEELFRLSYNRTIITRTWPRDDEPEIYRRKGAWWVELTDTSNQYEQSDGVVWSDSATLSLLWSPSSAALPGDTK